MKPTLYIVFLAICFCQVLSATTAGLTDKNQKPVVETAVNNEHDSLHTDNPPVPAKHDRVESKVDSVKETSVVSATDDPPLPLPDIRPEPYADKNDTTSTSETPPTTPSTTTTKTTSTSPTTPTTPKTTPSPTPTPSPTSTSTPTTQPPSTTPITTPTPHTSTVHPTSTAPPPTPKPDRKFDGLSFFAGIVLSAGLLAIGVVAYKFYEARRERNYHTL